MTAAENYELISYILMYHFMTVLLSDGVTVAVIVN